MTPALLGESTLRRSVRGNAAAANLRVPIAPPAEAELELVIDDGSNPPLDLRGVTAVFAQLPFVYFESERGEPRSEEHTSELQSRQYLVCRLLLEKKNKHVRLHH